MLILAETPAMALITTALAALSLAGASDRPCVPLTPQGAAPDFSGAICAELEPTPVVCYQVYSDLERRSRWVATSDSGSGLPEETQRFLSPPFERYSNFRSIGEIEWTRRAESVVRRQLGASGMMYFQRQEMDRLWEAETGQTARPRGPYEHEGIDPDGVTAPPFAHLVSACDAAFGFTPAFVYRTGAGSDAREAAWGCAADIYDLGQRRPDVRPHLGGLMREAMNAVTRAEPDALTPPQMMVRVRSWAAEAASDSDDAVIARVQHCARALPPGRWLEVLEDL
ncbi:hypothetical protein F1654_03525 [Alkalicaulis satelles]|uniref:Uncharacterized protein n=1 Tax=Alkalicaulis satelles TaxID=2609175 RepID=A0A5M6ZJT3_9PROT|nr:hypothetical protein [Alkalicaulis satelles]KAA5805073.1 hypothetical protein F1654_03525 [Alkalicaulis satelles]